MICKLCNRKALEKYCDFHKKAHSNIIKNFTSWRKAFDISWKEYLKEVIENSYTGRWAKEVAEDLLNNKEV